MPKKPLDAIFKRHNKKVYITLIHRVCRTAVQIKAFPEGLPVSTMTSWINSKNEMLEFTHECSFLADTGELAMHGGADTRLL